MNELEFEVDFGAGLEYVFHRDCFYAWEGECRKLLEEQAQERQAHGRLEPDR